MSYSIDLREKIEDFIKSTKNMREASRVFGINYNTARKWFKVYEEENRLAPKEPYRQEPYKMDWEELRRYVEKNPDLYQEEYAKEFGVSSGQISKVLKRLGMTYKKRVRAIQSKMSKRSLSLRTKRRK